MLKKRDVQKLFVEDTVRKKLSKIIHERNGTGWSQHGNEEIKFWAGGLDEKNPSSSVWIHILQPTKDPRTKSEEINTFSLSSWDWTVIFSYSWVFSHKMGLVSFAVLALRLCNLDQIILPAFPILQLTKGTGRDFWASITTWQSLCVNKQMNEKKSIFYSIYPIFWRTSTNALHILSISTNHSFSPTLYLVCSLSNSQLSWKNDVLWRCKKISAPMRRLGRRKGKPSESVIWIPTISTSDRSCCVTSTPCLALNMCQLGSKL